MSPRSTTQRSSTFHALLAAMTVAVLAAGCAAGTSRAGVGPRSDVMRSDVARADVAAQAVSRSRYIGVGEISTIHEVANAEEVIRRLRPELLRPRRTHSGFQTAYATPIVYLNGLKIGGLETLSTIPASVLQDVRYLSEVEAGIRFMGVHPVGAIVIRTR
jgi:hypothetical protein